MRPNPSASACVFAVGLLLLAGGAGAAPTWGPPTRISPVDGGPSVQSPRVATNSASASVIVWERAEVVQAISRRGRSAAWSSPVDLSAGHEPLVAMDASGGAVVAYTKGTFPRVPQAVYRASGTADWETPVTVSATGEVTDLAVNERGDVVLGLTSFVGGSFVAEAAYRAAGVPTWQPAVGLSDPGGSAGETRVAIDGAGNALAVWVRSPGSGEAVVAASFRSAASSVWERPVIRSGPVTEVHPVAAMSRNGTAVAAWVATRIEGGTATESVEASLRSGGGTWSAPAALSTPAYLVRDLRLVLDPRGNALAVWIQIQPDVYINVQAASRTAGSTGWAATVDVSPRVFGNYVSGLALALDEAGNAVATWAGRQLTAAIRPAAGGVWQPGVEIGGPQATSYATDVALDGTGNAIAVWATSTFPSLVEADELDGTGPVMVRLDVPPEPVARVPSTFNAEIVPWASPLARTPHWSFGDGASADGATVRHVYAAPGTYSVSVAQADAAGGTTTATRTIAVAAPTALVNSVRPSIRGRPRVGATLTCRPGRWAGTAPIRYAYSWLRAAHRVSVGPRRRLVRADAGALVSCRVRATNPAGAAEARSRAVRVRR